MIVVHPRLALLAGSLWLLTAAAAQANQYVYPSRGQDRATQARDEAECSTWATQQSGFDPAAKPAQTAAKSARDSDVMVDAAAKALSNPATLAAIGALAGGKGGSLGGLAGVMTGTPSAGSLGSVASLLGGSTGAASPLGSLGGVAGLLGGSQNAYTSGAAALLNPAVAQPRPKPAEAAPQAEFDRARAACLTGRGYSVQ